jgi:hypothetical protein
MSNQSDINLAELIKILKEIEYDMQTMHKKLNDMNDMGLFVCFFTCHVSNIMNYDRLTLYNRRIFLYFYEVFMTLSRVLSRHKMIFDKFNISDAHAFFR